MVVNIDIFGTENQTCYWEFGWITLWPEWHFDQSDPLVEDPLARDTLVRERVGQTDNGQTVSPAKLSLAKVSLQPKHLWPKCHRPNCHSSQSFFLAKVSQPKCLWPKCHSGQIVIQPENSNPIIVKEEAWKPTHSRAKTRKCLFGPDWTSKCRVQ